MNELLAWMMQLGRVRTQRPELIGSLLTSRFAPYALYRLRFLLPQLVLGVITELFEVLALAQVLPWDYFAPLLRYRAAAALIGGCYWGLLEGLRARVREHVRARHYESAKLAVESWLALAWLASAICMIAVGLGTRLLAPRAGSGLSLFDAYGYACFFRLSCDLIAGTYHAGIFAVQRVYRPLWSTIGPPLVELLLIALCWRLLGAWGIPLSIVLAGLVRTALTLRYAHRAFLHSRIAPPALKFARRALTRLRARELLSALVHALANATNRLDAVLILGLLHTASSQDGQVSIAVAYYVLRPIIAAAQGWTRAFYFDWKRLESGAARVLQWRFRRALARLAVVVGLGLGILLLITGTWLWGRSASAVLLSLVALVWARAWFSLLQVEAFALGRHDILAALAATSATVTVTGVWFELSPQALLVTAAATLSAAAGWNLHRSPSFSAAAGNGLAGWLDRCLRSDVPCTVQLMQVRRDLTTTRRVARALGKLFEPQHMLLTGNAYVFAFSHAPDAPDMNSLIGASGGTLVASYRFDAEHGRALLAQLRRHPLACSQLKLGSGESMSRNELLAQFRSLFPDGRVLDFSSLASSLETRSLSLSERAAILRGIASTASSTGRGRTSQHGVAVLAPAGWADVLFLSRTCTPEFKVFARRVEGQSVRMTLTRVADAALDAVPHRPVTSDRGSTRER